MRDRALAQRAISLLDLTELGNSATPDDVECLMRKARGRGNVPAVAAVCLWSQFVPLARAKRDSEGVRIATVINFPAGISPLGTVIEEAVRALHLGADELDLVMPYAAFLNGDSQGAGGMIAGVKALLPPGKSLKVILETGAYPECRTVRRAADLAIEKGADFIKTSTGKIPQGASLAAVETMLEAIKASACPVGIKPSGGIRTLADARDYLDLADRIMGPDWACPHTFRFGASGLHDVLTAVLQERSPLSAKGEY